VLEQREHSQLKKGGWMMVELLSVSSCLSVGQILSFIAFIISFGVLVILIPLVLWLLFFYPFGSSANRVFRIGLSEGIRQIKIFDLKPEEFKSKELSNMGMSIIEKDKNVSIIYVGRDQEGNFYRASEFVDNWTRDFKVVGTKFLGGEVIVEVEKDFKHFFISLGKIIGFCLFIGYFFFIVFVMPTIIILSR
jgi:hypothetical protein